MTPFQLILARLRAYPRALVIASAALLVTAGVTLALGQGIRWVVDRGLAADNLAQLELGLLILMVIAVIMALGTYVRFYMMSWLGERISADLRRMAFDSLLNQSPEYFDQHQSGEIMSRITADTSVLQSLIGSSISLALRNAVTSTGGLIMMLATSPRLTGLILLGVPLVMVPIILLGRRVRKLSRDSQDSLAAVGQNAGEAIQEIKTVHAFGQTQRMKNQFEGFVESAFGVAKKRIAQRSALIAAVIILVFLSLSVMLWVGGSDVISGRLSPGDLSAFVFYALLVAMGAATLAEVTSEVQRASGATERLAEFIHLEPAHQFGQDPIEQPDADLVFDRVDFSYPSRSDVVVLDGLSLTLRAGQTTALVGPSGAGKSSLFDLLLRHRVPNQGSICIGDQRLDSIDEAALRQWISVVPQQPTLFSLSIAENIAFGRPDASPTQIAAAAQQAGIDDFIRGLPDGYDTPVGERGIQLSGGQRQRIAIARALLAGTRWLLFDEATSALDSHSESHILTTLNQMRSTVSCIVIAHRISTIADADRILVMDRGRIHDQGTHQELLERSDIYQQLQPGFDAS